MVLVNQIPSAKPDSTLLPLRDASVSTESTATGNGVQSTNDSVYSSTIRQLFHPRFKTLSACLEVPRLGAQVFCQVKPGLNRVYCDDFSWYIVQSVDQST